MLGFYYQVIYMVSERIDFIGYLGFFEKDRYILDFNYGKICMSIYNW